MAAKVTFSRGEAKLRSLASERLGPLGLVHLRDMLYGRWATADILQRVAFGARHGKEGEFCFSFGVGVRFEAVAKLLWENRRPDVRPNYRIAPGEVLIVDEASMLTSNQFAQLTRLAETAEAKIVAVGDYRQLGAVDAGGLFQLLARDGRAGELSGVWRFTHDWERAASLRVAELGRLPCCLSPGSSVSIPPC